MKNLKEFQFGAKKPIQNRDLLNKEIRKCFIKRWLCGFY